MVHQTRISKRSKQSARTRQKSIKFNDIVAVKLVMLAEAVSRSASQLYEKRFGLKNTDLRIMGHLNSDGPLAVREISRRSRIDKAWISRSVEALAKRGLVKKTPHPTDSRVTLLSLTKKGQELANAVDRESQKRQQQLLKGSSEHEVQRILDALFERVLEMSKTSGD